MPPALFNLPSFGEGRFLLGQSRISFAFFLSTCCSSGSISVIWSCHIHPSACPAHTQPGSEQLSSLPGTSEHKNKLSRDSMVVSLAMRAAHSTCRVLRIFPSLVLIGHSILQNSILQNIPAKPLMAEKLNALVCKISSRMQDSLLARWKTQISRGCWRAGPC